MWWFIAPALTVVTVALLRMVGLHRARVCSVRSTEAIRLFHVSAAIGLLAVAAPVTVVDPTIPGDGRRRRGHGVPRPARRPGRLRSLPMGHEPLLYLEPAGMNAPWYAHLKRLIDVVGVTVALVVEAPAYAVAAIAIKLTDSGPVLFRRERVGMANRPFGLFKLRSMTVDAEDRLAELMKQNQRDDGPLFKLDCDPRVTRVGAILRATSFDEIPQLLNVLRGEMSLVGPRPALPGEVAKFDDEFLVRQRVRPGVTGLWQVEARDDPSFSAYRYLDVFYVENQSLALDLAILMATVRAVAASCARALRVRTRSPNHPSVHPATEEIDLIAS